MSIHDAIPPFTWRFFMASCIVITKQIALAQTSTLSFGEERSADNTKKKQPITWINVNTDPGTWSLRKDELICTGKPIGVMRSEKQYENFILHVEWMHMEAGG